MSSFINDELFARQMRETLNAEMSKAAEPIVRKAMQDIEAEMRKRLGTMLVSLVDSSYSLSRDGRDIVVRVAMGKTVTKGE